MLHEGFRSNVIVSLYKAEREMTKCKNYRDISLLIVVGKIYTGVLLDRVRRVTEVLTDDEQGVSDKGGGV